ncbi:unnamed protein product [Effrenium voratum]|uniref:RNA helicase n=1 Tax=Effrenium voratum TaxID=2562239 RepID=A0AA36IXP5_9DINO|nr:unnamed protein product [Effrenium voratum]CAJ1421443.1 unnamed protein product [Effrenium voratum]
MAGPPAVPLGPLPPGPVVSATQEGEPEAEPQAGFSRLGPLRTERTKARYEGYCAHPNLDGSDQEWHLRHGVSVLEDGGCRFGPTTTLLDACLPDWMRAQLGRFGEPTPLQAVAWPALRTNRDLVAVAEPGCGKTLAYAVPLLVRAAALQGARAEQPDWWQQLAWTEWRQRPPDGVVLVGTAELAHQVKQLMEPLAEAGRVQVAGGGDAEASPDGAKELSRAGVLVLTPWQLQLQSWALGNEDLTALNQDILIVFDGADRIIKDGEDDGAQARTVLDLLPKNRVLAFFSPTWPQRTEQMARRHLRNDAVLIHATTECPANASGFCLESRFVVQRFEVMHVLAKPAKLLEAVQAAARRKGGMAIFCNSHTEVEKVAQGLQGLTVVQVHEHANEDETQERLNALDGTWAIVATTMLGRGVVFPKVQWLINYDMPSILEYLLRVRLAGRGSLPGRALTFLTKADLLEAQDLIAILESLGQEVPEFLRGAAANYMEHLRREDPDEAMRRERRTRAFHGRHSVRREVGSWQGSRPPRHVDPVLDGTWKDYKPTGYVRTAQAVRAPVRRPTPEAKLKPANELPDLIDLD